MVVCARGPSTSPRSNPVAPRDGHGRAGPRSIEKEAMQESDPYGPPSAVAVTRAAIRPPSRRRRSQLSSISAARVRLGEVGRDERTRPYRIPRRHGRRGGVRFVRSGRVGQRAGLCARPRDDASRPGGVRCRRFLRRLGRRRQRPHTAAQRACWSPTVWHCAVTIILRRRVVAALADT